MMEYEFDIPLYKYRNFESAKMLLETETIYFSSPSQFNDPFEFSEKLLDFSFSRAFAKKHIENIPLIKSLTRKNRRQISNQNQTQLYEKSVRQMVDRKRNSCGVFCGSELYDDTLMWSHYANNHTGFCIGFEFPKNQQCLDDFLNNEGIIALRVNYTDNIVKVPCVVNEVLFPDETIEHWFATKSKAWAYEKEMRLIKYSNKGLVRFPVEWIKEIYFGLLTPKLQIEEIVDIVRSKYRNCTLYDMKFKNGSFQLVREPYKKRK